MPPAGQAREALGQRLRELRVDAGLTGRGLADTLGWPQSKVSKVETGRQAPTEADILAWTAAVGADGETGDLLATLRTMEAQYAEWRRQHREGMRARQMSIMALEAQTTEIRAFETTVVPGLVQTSEYARHRLAAGQRLANAPDDLDDAVAARMQRQDVLYRPGKRFHFVVTEAALRTRVCPWEVTVGQLDRLRALAAMPNLQFGVIPDLTELSVAPKHGFWIFDQELVLVDTIAAELTLARPGELDLYSRVFGELASVARYGPDAQRLISSIQDQIVRSSSGP